MNTICRNDISPEAAQALVDAAIAHAQLNDWEVAVAVVDRTGLLVAFRRTTDVTVPAIDFAMDKAYTASTLRRSTKDFFERSQTSPSLAAGLANRPRLMLWSGGLPLYDAGRCIGGIGVSGAKDFQDVECAEIAMAKLGLGVAAAT
jgi:uncharacterized protein GlcG (DUF336 family)